MKNLKTIFFPLILSSFGIAKAQQPAIHVDINNNVGIGTNTPNSGFKLDIKGNLKLTSNTNSLIKADKNLILTSSSGHVEIKSGHQKNGLIIREQGSSTKWGNIATTPDGLGFSYNESEPTILIIPEIPGPASQGGSEGVNFVGINTTKPEKALDVKGVIRSQAKDANTYAQIHMHSFDNKKNAALVYTNGTNDHVWTSGSVWEFGNGGKNQYAWTFKELKANGGAWVERMTLVPITPAYYKAPNALLGICDEDPKYTLTVNGDAAKKGNSNWTVYSDRRLKEDIKPFVDGLQQIVKINPVSFKYNGKGTSGKDGKEYIGVIAQDIQKIAPYMVGSIKGKLNPEDEEETDILDYNNTALVYILVNAVKELSEKNESLTIALKSTTQKLIVNQNEIKEIKSILNTTAQK